jgi:threonine/homoserine/homoserine lactone efflux protein
MTQLVPYLGLCVLITLTPGLDTAVVIRSSLRGGARAGLRTAMGCASGLLVHATAVSLGLAALLLRSAAAYEVMKVVGAGVLFVLGARSLWASWRARKSAGQAGTQLEEPERARVFGSKPFMQGLLTDLTNPKATLFFVATLPPFIPTDRPLAALPIALALASITTLCSFTGLSLTAIGVNRIRHLFGSNRFRRIQEGFLGAALVALGVRVATE